MKSNRVVGILVVTVLALAWGGCKKKPKDKGSDKAAMASMDAMRAAPMGAMRAAPMDAMRPEAMKTAMRPEAMKTAMSVVAVKMEKPSGMVVIPKGKNPLAGVDISKGFGEGWFNKGQKPGMNPAAMQQPPAAMNPGGLASRPATMAPVMAPAGMAPATRAARPRPKPLPSTRYVHPDKSFTFRHPVGWTPKVKVGRVRGVPTFVIQVRKVLNKAGAGELGALAFILPKKAPDSKTTCKQLIGIVKKNTPSLKAGPLKPFQKSGLYMFQARSKEGNETQISMALCGTAHGRIMIMTYFTVGAGFGSRSYGYQLGVALYTFTSDLLKK